MKTVSSKQEAVSREQSAVSGKQGTAHSSQLTAHSKPLLTAHCSLPSASWSGAYIGLPFADDGRDRDGCDCWGLIMMVYHDILGITLHDYAGLAAGSSVAALLRRAKLMDTERANWERRSQYEVPKPFDIVLLRTKGVPSHVGIVIDSRRMLHITEGINSCVEDFTGPMWKDRVLGFYWRAYD